MAVFGAAHMWTRKVRDEVAVDPADMKMEQKDQAMHMILEDRAVLSQLSHYGAGVSLPRPRDYLAPETP